MNLSTLVLNYLCDAYDEPSYQGKPRQRLKLHRKLAPYKISFSISSSSKSQKNQDCNAHNIMCLKTKCLLLALFL